MYLNSEVGKIILPPLCITTKLNVKSAFNLELITAVKACGLKTPSKQLRIQAEMCWAGLV